jgi:hypothetical protein
MRLAGPDSANWPARITRQRGVVEADAAEDFAGAFAALRPGELWFLDGEWLGHGFANTHAGID